MSGYRDHLAGSVAAAFWTGLAGGGLAALLLAWGAAWMAPSG